MSRECRHIYTRSSSLTEINDASACAAYKKKIRKSRRTHRTRERYETRLEMDNFAAAAATRLNRLVLDGAISSPLVVADPRTLGRCAGICTMRQKPSWSAI